MQDSFARARTRPSARATIGYLVYKHKSVIFHRILSLSLLVNILVFDPIFSLRPHMGKIVRMDPKPHFKIPGRVLAFPFNPYLKIKVSVIISLNPRTPRKGAGGGLHRNSLEIDFIVVSDRGE